MSSGNVYPVGLNFGGKAAQKLEAKLGGLAAENSRRRPCPFHGCPVRPLPETMARHIALCHGDDE